MALLDMGWRDFKVAVEYDGDHHRKDRRQYVKDIARLRMLEALGWIVIRVIAEDKPRDVIARVEAALIRRGCCLEFDDLCDSPARWRLSCLHAAGRCEPFAA